MDRSSGFGSTPCYSTPLSDSLSLRLPYSVKLATQRKSLTHYTKGTQSPLHKEPSGFFVQRRPHRYAMWPPCPPVKLPSSTTVRFYFFLCSFGSALARSAERTLKMLCAGAPTVCMHAVSGSISLPSRGSFRLSLTVLVHYRSITSI